MKAVILAGGEGVRLRPLTCRQPKPMLEILGKPVLEYTLEHLKNHGVDEVYLTLQYLPQKVMEYFGEEYEGIKLNFCLEEIPLGTAGCVKQLEKYLEDTFMVISGDALTDVDLTKALNSHREMKAEATLVVKEVESPVEYGIVTLDERGRVQRFQEKPGWSEVFSNLANTGIYILEPSVLADIPCEETCDFSKEVFPKMLQEERRVAGYVMEGYWCDIGSHEDYLNAQFDLLEGRCALKAAGETVQKGIMIAPDARVDPGARITPPCWIASGCRVASGADIGPGAVLGSGSCVERGAGIKHSMTGRNCHLGRRSQLRGVILGEGCHVKAGAELYEGAVAGDTSVIGAFSRIMPGSRVWPGKLVEDFSHIQGAVRWGSTALKRPLTGSCLRAEDWAELPPERIFAWGSAAAAACGGQMLVLSDDGSERAQTVRAALQAGAACSGAVIQPLAHANLPMHRFTQRMLGATLGACVSAGEDGFSIHFLGENGEDISARMEKKLDNALRRGTEPVMSPMTVMPELEVETLYLAHLKSLVEPAEDSRMAVFCEDPGLLAWAGRMLKALGFETLLSPKAPDRDRKIPSGEYRARMLEAKAGMGLRLEGDAYQLVDGQGKIYLDWMLEPLLEAVVPQESLRRRMMGDGVLAAAFLHRICGGDLETCMREYPVPERWERTVPCPWSERGRVAAELDCWPDFIREDNGSRVRKDRKITITPQENMPLIRLTAQNVSQEMAGEILGEYEKKLLEQMRI